MEGTNKDAFSNTQREYTVDLICYTNAIKYFVSISVPQNQLWDIAAVEPS